MQHELAIVQRAPQAGFQREAAHRALVHGGVVDLVAPLAQRLGPVHGQVRVVQHFLGRCVAERAGGNADAGAGVELLALDHERRFKRMHQALGDAHRLVHVVDAVEQDGEFIAAHAGQRIVHAQALPQPRRHLHDQRVAGEVAKAVVDQLEAVQVDKEHRKRLLAMPAAARHGAGQPVREQGAVGQPR